MAEVKAVVKKYFEELFGMDFYVLIQFGGKCHTLPVVYLFLFILM